MRVLPEPVASATRTLPTSRVTLVLGEPGPLGWPQQPALYGQRSQVALGPLPLQKFGAGPGQGLPPAHRLEEGVEQVPQLGGPVRAGRPQVLGNGGQFLVALRLGHPGEAGVDLDLVGQAGSGEVARTEGGGFGADVHLGV